jgi:hypothetical protein
MNEYPGDLEYILPLAGIVLFKMNIDEVVRSNLSQWVVSFGIVKGRDNFLHIRIQIIRPPLQH